MRLTRYQTAALWEVGEAAKAGKPLRSVPPPQSMCETAMPFRKLLLKGLAVREWHEYSHANVWQLTPEGWRLWEKFPR